MQSIDSIKSTSDGLVMVDTQYHWLPVSPDTPVGVKLQLINKSAGVAVYGTYHPDDEFYTHWAPLPTFRR